MDLGLRGKRALVLGGSRGIGRGIAEALAAEGTALALVSRRQDALDQAAHEISDRFGVKAMGVAGDLASRPSIEQAFDQARQVLGSVDILVNISGGPLPSGIAGVDRDLLRREFETMVLNIIGLSDLALPEMRSRRWGRILTVGSSGVIEPIASIGVSNTLRSALVGWSKTLASEVALDGVTVNMLIPGRIATDRIRALDKASAEKAGISREEVTTQKSREIPVGRYGTIEEFGAVAAFLASERAAYVTGSMIRIDGGLIRSI